MLLTLARSDVRSWRASDLDSLVLHANNRNVWINLRDRFPHPYAKSDGRAFIRATRKMRPETLFAIAVDNVAVGGIGFVREGDVERVSAEIGY
jgi:RimJ/RimL family protein N-acetyltransferase